MHSIRTHLISISNVGKGEDYRLERLLIDDLGSSSLGMLEMGKQSLLVLQVPCKPGYNGSHLF